MNLCLMVAPLHSHIFVDSISKATSMLLLSPNAISNGGDFTD